MPAQVVPFAPQPRCEPGEGAGGPCNRQSWWTEMPPDGQPFDSIQFVVTPAAGAPETVVLTLPVPTGMDGVIHDVMHHFEGAGFVPGSGNLIWRLRVGINGVGAKPVRFYQDMRVEYGDLAEMRLVRGGIMVSSGETIVYTVVHGALSPIVPAGTRIFCGVRGWFAPRGSNRCQ